MRKGKYIKKIISLILTISIIMSLVACGNTAPTPTLSDPSSTVKEENIEVENIEVENVDVENIYTEFITEEIYTTEFIEGEKQITELLLEEEIIVEVLECKTIYVPEEHIEDFSDHSQAAQLFGQDFDIKPVLKKVAIGTGIIITLAIVKKAGVPQPIASIVTAAADESLQFAKSGAVVGTVYGGFTGASNEIDESGRMSAVAGFALATAGLIITAISFANAIPTAGTSSFGLAEGIRLAWAGIKVVVATKGTIYAARDTVKAFTSTDISEIDWNNVDWDAVGVSAAQKAIQNGADGYMWGAIYGAIDGTIVEYYQKYCTPYTQYQDRLNNVPKNGDRGHWTGDRGESYFVLNEPIELPDGTKITQIYYQNAVPDFSPYAIAEVKIPNMSSERYIKGGNFDQADAALAEYWTNIKYNNRSIWTADDVKVFRENYPYRLTWHEMSNMESMQLVPYEVNNTFGHYGGVAEYKAMTGQSGGEDFD